MRNINELKVNLGKNSYSIFIGKNYYNKFSEYIKKVYNGKKIFIITDSNVNKLYEEHYSDMFKDYNYDVFVMKAGEKNKTLNTVYKVYEKMVLCNIKRTDLVIALGGGVVGDLAGFVASTYLRGVNFVQIPTTIIAQVDSSVGGKVGVDLPYGKNLVGAFHQPKLVLIDEFFLNTLHNKYFYDGFGEIVKYGCIFDEKLFSKLENITVYSKNKNNLRKKLMDNIGEIILKSCEIKAKIIENDEKETGLRMILNFGHTIGHAIEQYTGYSKYSHGECVAIGMMEIVKKGINKKITDVSSLKRIEALLKSLNLPIESNIELKELEEIMSRDKKSTEDGINFIFLKEIGRVEVIKMTITDFFK